MRREQRSRLALSAAAFLFVVSATGVDARQAEKKQTLPPPTTSATKHTMVTPDQVKFGPAPPGLPAGGQMAVIDGDPGKPALFTARLKMPDGYKIPPHWHPTDEHVTVLSGTLKAGSGAQWDDASMHPLPAGSYANMRRKQNHYVTAQGETVVQITAMGPFEITYVNAQDDPRKKSSN
ncbi:MAG: cupin domain-containing protein [Vicinamibacterales bacterium]